MDTNLFPKNGKGKNEETPWLEPAGASANLSHPETIPSGNSGSNRPSLFVTSTKAVWLAGSLALLALWGAFLADRNVLDFVHAHARGWSLQVARQISIWGDWYGVAVVGLLGWWQAKRRKSEYWKRLLLVMGVCAAFSGLGANVIRSMSGRARPHSGAAAGWYGPFAKHHPLRSAHAFQSFPSAHTSVVAGFCAPMGWVALRSRRRRALWIFLPLSLSATALMGWSRVWVGAHHLSDVLAAALLGWSIALGWLHYRVSDLSAPPR